MRCMMRYGALAIALSLLAPGARAEPLAVELEDAADHHVSGQGSYRGGLRNSWEYKMGSQRSAPNITGVTADGLLAAYQLTKLEEHQNAALRAARSLIRAYDGAWKTRRPYTQDVEFLAAAGFIIDAGRWFQVTRDRYTPAGYADFVSDGRKAGGTPELAGWDLASAIRAAIAVGQLAYARGLVAELVARRHAWDRAGGGQLLARGSVLWALASARDRVGLTPEQRQLAESLVRDMVAAQRANGAYLAGGELCTQTVAYAVLGLTRWPGGRAAAAKGRAWLRRVAHTDQRFFAGGRIWATTYRIDGRPENDYNSEVQSEAMLALASGR